MSSWHDNDEMLLLAAMESQRGEDWHMRYDAERLAYEDSVMEAEQRENDLRRDLRFLGIMLVILVFSVAALFVAFVMAMRALA